MNESMPATTYPSTLTAIAVVAGLWAAPALGDARVGERVYGQVCMACHLTGVLGAPKVGDKAAWQPRYHEGVEHLVDQAINGIGAMPPRGGKDSLSDKEIEAAIVHMLRNSGIEMN
jgi:cytochrome c5